jgi:hypothetical protein
MPFICHQICIHMPLTHQQWSTEHNTVFEKHKITNFFCAPPLKKHERSAQFLALVLTLRIIKFHASLR